MTHISDPKVSWACSGDLVGNGHPTNRHEPCDFTTDSQTDAFTHFEQTGHAVDPVEGID